MNNQEQANTNDPLGIIGKKMKGFKFESGAYKGIGCDDTLIGVSGQIIGYNKDHNAYRCDFGKRIWHYPADLIMQHIVDTPQDNQQDTPQQLTLLEKFEQGWEIMELHNGFRIIDIAKTIKGRYFVKWSDGKIEQYDDLILNAVTCTPPKERKTLYLYERDEKTSFCVTTVKFPECGIITEIHLEKNGDNWEVVKP